MTNTISRNLDDIAADIRVEWTSFQLRQTDQIESRIRIGILLVEARALKPGNREFGKWVEEQNFGTLSTSTLWSLRRLGERPERARLEAVLFSKENGEVNTQKWAASVPMPQSMVATELDVRPYGSPHGLSGPQQADLGSQEWFTFKALREARDWMLGIEPDPDGTREDDIASKARLKSKQMEADDKAAAHTLKTWAEIALSIRYFQATAEAARASFAPEHRREVIRKIEATIGDLQTIIQSYKETK